MNIQEERAAFEKAVVGLAERFHPDLEQYGDHPDAEYKSPTNQWAWELWQVRASLEKK